MSTTKLMFTPDETKILKSIQRWRLKNYHRYDFWFTYDDQNIAVGWEGGYDMPVLDTCFRNEYGIMIDGTVVQNSF